MRAFRLLVGITGCAQAENSAQWLEQARAIASKVPLDIAVVTTRGAARFIDARRLRKMFPGRVFDGYDAATAEFPVPHIQLAEWADLVLVYPASANTLARCAHGFTDELLANAVLAARCPVYFGPTMNDAMYESKAVQSNLRKIRALGYKLVPREKAKVFIHSLGREVVKEFCTERSVLRCLLAEMKRKLVK